MTLNMNQGIELQGLIARLRNEKVSIKTAYKFNKLITILEKELSFYNEELAKIIDQYAQKDKDGNIQKPLIVIKETTYNYDDGTATEYMSLGYKYVEYNRNSLRAYEFGPFWVKIRD